MSSRYSKQLFTFAAVFNFLACAILYAVLFWRFYLQQEIPAGNQPTHP